VKLYVDENLPPVLARSFQILFEGQHVVTCTADKFARRGVKDIEWITELGREGGWSVLSADKRISRNQIEKRAFLEAGLIGFILAPSLQKLALAKQAARILQLWDVLDQQSRLVSRGLFELPISTNRLRQITL